MKNKGFTLVELLAVIVIMGLILAIAVPNAFKLSNKVKTKAYKTKIEQIESGAGETYGTNNLGSIRTSKSKCAFKFKGNDEIDTVYYAENGVLNESGASGLETYPCVRMSVKDLVETGSLDYDHKKQCDQYNCPKEEKQRAYYDSVVVNPVDDYIINECNVYIYYKYTRAYAVFDKTTCDERRDQPDIGHEYRRLSKKITSTTKK